MAAEYTPLRAAEPSAQAGRDERNPQIWHFAVVFGVTPIWKQAKRPPTGEQQSRHPKLEDLIVHWCTEFHASGFEVALAPRTHQTRDRVAVLLWMPKAQIKAEWQGLELERWMSTGAGPSFERDAVAEDRIGAAPGGPRDRMCITSEPTEADEFFAMATILRNTCKLGPLEFLHTRSRDDEDRLDPRILAVLPLKDEPKVGEFKASWRREGGVCASLKGINKVLEERRREWKQAVLGVKQRAASAMDKKSAAPAQLSPPPQTEAEQQKAEGARNMFRKTVSKVQLVNQMSRTMTTSISVPNSQDECYFCKQPGHWKIHNGEPSCPAYIAHLEQFPEDEDEDDMLGAAVAGKLCKSKNLYEIFDAFLSRDNEHIHQLRAMYGAPVNAPLAVRCADAHSACRFS